jgi:putative endonuclease
MPREYRFYVYILQSSSRRALYMGMTNNLHRRVFEHKTHRLEGFTDDYNAVRLVYWERFESVQRAIVREKQLKNWRREKKLWLIGRFNPNGRIWLKPGIHIWRARKHKAPRLALAFARDGARDDKG